MKFLAPACLALIFVGCIKSKVHPADPMDLGAELSAKVALYETLLPEAQGDGGFIQTDTCDSLLFSGLLGVADHVSLNLRAAREPSGRWQRRPLSYSDCYPDHTSTTISRDMLFGVLWYSYSHGDKELVENLWSYGSSHSWIMGDGPRDTVWMPELSSTIAQLLYKLDGADHKERLLSILWPSGQVGFRAHIIALHLLLRNRIYGTIEESGQAFVKEQVARQPRNPLFQCAAGNSSAVIDILKDEHYWPAGRLPTSDDRCDGWLPQRDYGDDWLPCEGKKTHSGGDLLFLAKLVSAGWCG